MPSAASERLAELMSNKDYSVSGNTYVSAMLRGDIGKYPMRDFLVRLPVIGKRDVCDHTVTICPTWECVESWSIDYALYFHRTGGGRRIARELKIDPEIELRPGGGSDILKYEDFKIESTD
jgi:hypothetical protein